MAKGKIFALQIFNFGPSPLQFLDPPLLIFLLFHPAPHSPPANVQGSGISSTDMLVTWDIIPPIDQNGVITAYEVLYVPLETFGGVLQTRITNVPGTETAVILTGLEEFVGYSISVRGFTAAGAGPYSNAVEATTLEDGMI